MRNDEYLTYIYNFLLFLLILCIHLFKFKIIIFLSIRFVIQHQSLDIQTFDNYIFDTLKR